MTAKMAWYANIVSTTTSRISNLRSTLLGGDADGDTEDDTNVCRVLRAYYTEKGRQYPQWLPPDPRAPPAPVATPVSSVGSRYGGGNLTQSVSAGGQPATGLSSLWDKPASPAPQAQQQNSLRPARASPFQNRPDAGQRLNSYQSTTSVQSAPPANTAQDKLRGLFSSGGSNASHGVPSRSNSPAYGSAPNNNGGYGGGNPYGNRGGGGSGEGGYSQNAPQYGNGGGPAPVQRQGLPSGPRRPVGGGLPSGPRLR